MKNRWDRLLIALLAMIIFLMCVMIGAAFHQAYVLPDVVEQRILEKVK